jgi:hypothetical protein
MDRKKWSIFFPVLIVLVLSVPLVTSTLWVDIKDVREVAKGSESTGGIFSGFTENTGTTVHIIPPSVIDDNIPDTTEKVNYTTSTGQNVTIEQRTPKGTLIGGILNALVMAGIAVIAAFGIFMLFKLRRKLTLKLFFAAALGLCSSVSLMLYLYLSRSMGEDLFGINLPDSYPLLGAIVIIGIIAGFLIVRNMVFRALDPKRKNPALIAFCILLGPFLAIVLPFWVVLFLLVLISLWDLWAAKRGIIKEMVNLSDQHKKEERVTKKATAASQGQKAGIETVKPTPMTKRKPLIQVNAGEDITTYGLYEGKHYSLGIGDFIFFSLLVSATFKWMLLKLPFAGFYSPFWGEVLAVELTVLVAMAILFGLDKTLSYLDRETVMPGLPLSILWGTVTLIILGLFLEAWNLIMVGRAFNPF